MKKEYVSFTTYLDELRKQGRSLFLKKEAGQTLKISDDALRNSIARLVIKGEVKHLKKGLYQIIPIDYEDSGSLPPEWIIHGLMAHLGIPYYVGLLSAAALHGAAHQAPQIFQVICQKKIPDLILGSFKICFYLSKDISTIPTQTMKTPAGYINVSTPEGTAFDLVRYFHQSGHLNHVATVLSELGEELDPQKIAAIAPNFSVRYSQRLGFLLDTLGYEAVTGPLHQFLSQERVIAVPLRPDISASGAPKDAKWRILINETVESDI